VYRSHPLRAVLALLTATAHAQAQTASASRPVTADRTAGGGAAQAPAGQGTTGGPEAGSSVREAQEHLSRALEHFRARRYVDAIHEFELANRAAPSADIWYNIARSHELLSHYDDAVEYYRRYLRDKVDPPDRADVERRIAELQRLAEQQRAAARRQVATGRIRFEITTPGVTLFLNDRQVGRSPAVEALTVEPGTYAVRAIAPGMQEWRGSVRARRGETVTAFIAPQPATEYRTISGGHLASYILGAAGLAAVGTGIGFGVSALSRSVCTGNLETGVADPCDRRDTATIADVSFGVGAGLLLTAAIVYFIEAGSSRTERVTRPAPQSAAPAPTR
jgi:hypothetical protein